MLQRIKIYILALILFIEQEVKRFLSIFLPNTKTLSASSSSNTSEAHHHQASTFFITSSSSSSKPQQQRRFSVSDDAANNFNNEKQQQQQTEEHVNKLRKTIDSTLRDHEDNWSEDWKENLPLPLCFLLSLQYFFVSRRFSWLFFPAFLADFFQKFVIHFISAFTVMTPTNSIILNRTNKCNLKQENESSVNQDNNNEVSGTEKQQPAAAATELPPVVIIRCNKNYGLFLYRDSVGRAQQQDSSEPAKSLSEEEKEEASPSPRKQDEEQADKMKTKKTSFVLDQQKFSKEDDNDSIHSDSSSSTSSSSSSSGHSDNNKGNNNGKQRKRKSTSNNNTSNPFSSASSSSRRAPTKSTSRRSAYHAPKNDDVNIDNPQQGDHVDRNQSPAPLKISAETEDERSTAGYRTDGGYDTDHSFGRNDDSGSKIQFVKNRNNDDDDVGLDRALAADHGSDDERKQPRSSMENDATPQIHNADEDNSQQQQNAEESDENNDDDEQTTYIWIDAAATRSAIPQWWTLFLKNNNNNNHNSKNVIRHCQLIHLPESVETQDCANMISPSSRESGLGAMFPHRQNIASSSSAAHHQDENENSKTEEARKRNENSTRVLTESLAEGIVSAWSLTAQGRLDQLDNNIENETTRQGQEEENTTDEKNTTTPKRLLRHQKICFVTTGYEAAAAMLLAATSTNEEMRDCFAGCIFIDALSDFSHYKHHNKIHFAPCLSDGPFSSLSDSRDITLFEEMWRRMRNSSKSSSHHDHSPASSVPRTSLSSLSNCSSSSFNSHINNSLFNMDVEIIEGSSLLPSSSSSSSHQQNDRSRISPSNKNAREKDSPEAVISTTTTTTKSALKKNNNNSNSSTKPVVFRVPSVPDWSQLLETSSQLSGRNTPSQSGNSVMTPKGGTSTNNTNTPTIKKFYKAGGEGNNSSSELFATPSIALKVDEDSLVEAASGVPRQDGEVQGSNNSRKDAMLDDTMFSMRGEGSSASFNASLTNGGGGGAGASQRPPAFDQLNIIEEGDGNDRINNSKNNENAFNDDEITSPRPSSSKRISELAHKTDQFFRNDMRSVAARIQLSHGSFVFINSKKQQLHAQPCQFAAHNDGRHVLETDNQKLRKDSSSSSKITSPMSSNNNNNNNNSGKSSSSSCASSNHYYVAPGTKLIQTWIRRIEKPKEFESLLMKAYQGTPRSSSLRRTSLFGSTNSFSQEGDTPTAKNPNNNNSNCSSSAALRKRTERKSRGQEVLFVKLPSSIVNASGDVSANHSTSVHPVPADQVLFLVIFWNYLVESSRIFYFVNRVYKKIVLDWFWMKFVSGFLMWDEENKEEKSVDNNGSHSKNKNYDQSKPLILNLVENLGKNF